MPFSVLDALRCSANSLRILDWSGCDFFPQLHHLEELLRDLPNLHVLCCPELVWADGIIPNSILSSLTTLAVGRLVKRAGHPGEGGLHEARVSLREIISHNRDLPEELIIHYGKNKVAALRVFQLLCPCVVKQLLTRPSEFFTWVIVKSLNENPFRVEDDRGNLLSGGCRISVPAFLMR
ncbi:hypothetical protein EV401DRAFT_1970527 [Pisolithus croceorrhizus]|nr:hypothetical protein EV401DRAFT_1970527 [Pisolithus croceorrhizus]